MLAAAITDQTADIVCIFFFKVKWLIYLTTRFLAAARDGLVESL